MFDGVRQNIMHAGGRIEGFTYTNSLEAVQSSLRIGERLIELDCVGLKDGFGLAHDGTEASHYGTTQQFGQMTLEEFRSLRVRRKFTPLDFETLDELIAQYPDAMFVIDCKFGGDAYESLMNFLVREHRHSLPSLCPQVYRSSDLAYLKAAGIERCLIALWKWYGRDALLSARLRFVDEVLASGVAILGVSLEYKYPARDLVNFRGDTCAALESRGIPIFFHGHEQHLPFHQVAALNSEVGFFSSRSYRELPEDFDVSAYQARYADVRQFTPIQAAAHYIEFGAPAGRQYR